MKRFCSCVLIAVFVAATSASVHAGDKAGCGAKLAAVKGAKTASSGCAKSTSGCGKSAAVASQRGGKVVEDAMARVMASMPQMTYKVGDMETPCCKTAEAKSAQNKMPIHYVVDGKSHECKTTAMNELARKMQAQMPKLASVTPAVDGEMMHCSKTAAKVAASKNTKVKYMLAGVEFDCPRHAEGVSNKLAAKMTEFAGGGCSESAKTASAGCGSKSAKTASASGCSKTCTTGAKTASAGCGSKSAKTASASGCSKTCTTGAKTASAGCGSKSAKTASASGCSKTCTTGAKTASAGCGSKSAKTASASGCSKTCTTGAKTASAGCGSKSAKTASAGGCSKTCTTGAKTASAGCGSKSAKTASAGCCSSKAGKGKSGCCADSKTVAAVMTPISNEPASLTNAKQMVRRIVEFVANAQTSQTS